MRVGIVNWVVESAAQHPNKSQNSVFGRRDLLSTPSKVRVAFLPTHSQYEAAEPACNQLIKLPTSQFMTRHLTKYSINFLIILQECS